MAYLSWWQWVMGCGGLVILLGASLWSADCWLTWRIRTRWETWFKAHEDQREHHDE